MKQEYETGNNTHAHMSINGTICCSDEEPIMIWWSTNCINNWCRSEWKKDRQIEKRTEKETTMEIHHPFLKDDVELVACLLLFFSLKGKRKSTSFSSLVFCLFWKWVYLYSSPGWSFEILWYFYKYVQCRIEKWI